MLTYKNIDIKEKCKYTDELMSSERGTNFMQFSTQKSSDIEPHHQLPELGNNKHSYMTITCV